MFGFPRARPGHPYLAGPPMLVAHRGGSRLAPENTMAAFRQAVEVWEADMLELDVHLSADGEVVVIHDPTLDRTTDGSGPVRDKSWEELGELDAGYRMVGLDGDRPYRGKGVRIPLLSELLEALPSTRLNIEIKAAEAARPAVELVERHGASHRVLVAAGDERNRRAARGYSGPWGASAQQVRPFFLLHRTPMGRLYTPRCDVFQVPEWAEGKHVVTERFVEEAHRRNIPVHVWTVDEPESMRRLLALGVDGVQSDRPDLLAQVLVDDHGRTPPPGLGPRDR